MLFKELRSIMNQNSSNQKAKITILEGFNNLLTYIGDELVKCIEDIFSILLSFISNQDETIIFQGKQNNEILKAKFTYYFDKHENKEKKVIRKILQFMQNPFERENLNVKSWVLGWLHYLINLENDSITYFFAEIVLNLILFLSKVGHKELKNNAINLLNFIQKKFLISDAIRDLNYDINFVYQLLDNYVNRDFNDTQRLYTIDWVKKILEIVFDLYEKKNLNFVEKNLIANGRFDQILLNSIDIINDYPNCENNNLKHDLLEYNEFISKKFEIWNQIFEEITENDCNKYSELLDFVCKKMSKSNKNTLYILIEWADKLFQKTPHSFSQHVYTLIDILENEDELILNSIIKFMTSLIHKLNNFDITAKIIFYFFNDRKVDSNLSGFLKFIKILFEKIDSLDFLLNILKEIKKQASEIFFCRIIYHFHLLLVFENNFKFLRVLLKKIKTKKFENQDLEAFKNIFKMWCYHSISLFSLCIISGNYQFALEIIKEISLEELKEVDLLHLTQFVKMIELPYFAYIRIDLLDMDRNYYLYKCLQCVMMILPQGHNFDILKNRLNCVVYFTHMGNQDIKKIKDDELFSDLTGIFTEHKNLLK